MGDCPIPQNANGATCTMGQCGFDCEDGFHKCGSSCLSNTSPNSCGSSCAPCPSTPNSTPICKVDGTCGANCDAGYFACETTSGAFTGCELDHWNFDDGTTQDFTANFNRGVTVAQWRSPSFSYYQNASNYSGMFYVNKDICGLATSYTTNPTRNGRTLSGYIYIAPALPPGSRFYLVLTSSAGYVDIDLPVPPPDQWSLVSHVTTFTDEPTRFSIAMDLGAAWSGTFYIDDWSWK
jgi:hypothetical protein